MLEPFSDSPFVILGVPPFATPDLIVERWKAHVKNVHPDKTHDVEANTKRTQVFNRAKERALAMTNSPTGVMVQKYFKSLSQPDRLRVLDDCEEMGVLYEALWVEQHWAGRQRAKNIRIENERVAQVRAENDEKEKERIELIRREAARIDAKRAENDAEEAKRYEALQAENNEKEGKRIALIREEAARIEATRAKNDADEKARIEDLKEKCTAQELERMDKVRADHDARFKETIADNDARETIRITRKIAENDAEEDERIEAKRAENDRIEAERIEAKRAENDLQCAAEIESRKTPKKRKRVSSAGNPRKHRKTWSSKDLEFTKNKIHTFIAEKLTRDPKKFTPSQDVIKAFTAVYPEENPDPNFFFRFMQKCLNDLSDDDDKLKTCSRKGVRGYKGFCIQAD